MREKAGNNIIQESNVNDIWKSINDILNPQKLARNSIKKEANDQLLDDPLEIAERFNTFFVEKV